MKKVIFLFLVFSFFVSSNVFAQYLFEKPPESRDKFYVDLSDEYRDEKSGYLEVLTGRRSRISIVPYYNATIILKIEVLNDEYKKYFNFDGNCALVADLPEKFDATIRIKITAWNDFFEKFEREMSFKIKSIKNIPKGKVLETVVGLPFGSFQLISEKDQTIGEAKNFIVKIQISRDYTSVDLVQSEQSWGYVKFYVGKNSYNLFDYIYNTPTFQAWWLDHAMFKTNTFLVQIFDSHRYYDNTKIAEKTIKIFR